MRFRDVIGLFLAFGFTPSVDSAYAVPNIIVIMTDDQRWDSIDGTHGARPGETVVMPNVTSLLVQQGVKFTNAFATTPLCAPSRASFFTGQRASTHGVKGNNFTAFHAFRDLETSLLPVWLQQRGYRTGFFGKYSNRYGVPVPPEEPDHLPRPLQYVPTGWNKWYALKGQGAYENPEIIDDVLDPPNGEVPGYSTTVLRDAAVAFIQASRADPSSPPFFVVFAPKAPHGIAGPDLYSLCPTGAPSSCPVPALDDRFTFTATWQTPVSFNEPDITDKPDWLNGVSPLTADNQTYVQDWRKRSLESLQEVDRAVGSIVVALSGGNSPDVSANTVIIYTSDNGYSWGEHRLHTKRSPYEESIRIPLIIRPAGGIPGGREDSSPVLNIDLAPTIAELAGATPQRCQEGKSLVPLIQSQPGAPLRTRFALENFGDTGGELPPPVPAWAAMRQLPPKRKYVEIKNVDGQGNVSIEQEYYGLALVGGDPAELENRGEVVSDTNAANAMRQMSFWLRLAIPGWAPPDDLVFGSSFECRDPSWSQQTASPDLRIVPQAGLSGTALGLEIEVNDADALHVQDDTPDDESHYRARFAFDPNGFDPGTDDEATVTLVFAGEENPTRRLVSVLLKKVGTSYSLIVNGRDADGLVVEQAVNITDAAHVVEFEWKKESSPGARDGYVNAWVDQPWDQTAIRPTAVIQLSNFNFDHSVDFVRMGALSLAAGASGTLYFDEFASQRNANGASSYIGP